MFLERIN